MARVSGVLYVCGALLVLTSLALPHPATDPAPLYVIAALACTAGLAIFWQAKRVRPWMMQTLLAVASFLVCLCIYFSGVAAGVYSTMFVWVVVVAACFSSVRGLALQMAWLLVAYGVTLSLLGRDANGFSSVTRWILTGFALIVTALATYWLEITRRRAEERLLGEIQTSERLRRELDHLAHHDHLTGVANRRRLEQHLPGQLEAARNQNAPICLIALDLNDFKSFNDTHGHAAGDRLLKAAASAWGAALRDGDLITRAGGDEFLVVLPDCPPDEAEQIAARLRNALPDGQTCATGISCWHAGESADEFLVRADEAMYEAKSGRMAGAPRR